MPLDMTSSLNNSATETDGTITPTPAKRLKKYSGMSSISDASSGAMEQSKELTEALQRHETTSLTESEYYTAQSEFTNPSNASSSIWR